MHLKFGNFVLYTHHSIV